MFDHAAPTRVNSTGGASSLRRRVPNSSRSEALSLGNDTHAPQTQAMKITPWRFLNTIVILALGIYKAVATYHGQTTAPTTTDWITGVVWTLISYWISFVEQDNPEAWFFGRDLAPSLGLVLILVVGVSLFIMMYAVPSALSLQSRIL
ncbi:hypothetical protein DFH06DRAFT_1481101 [Mycena polygramma]|nr:hypothetical protein DFH06DRAFT_1481101 [Mycena polygramma]